MVEGRAHSWGSAVVPPLLFVYLPSSPRMEVSHLRCRPQSPAGCSHRCWAEAWTRGKEFTAQNSNGHLMIQGWASVGGQGGNGTVEPSGRD